MTQLHTSAAVVIVPVAEPPKHLAEWSHGPLPLEWRPGIVTDRDVRSEYFEERACRALYDKRLYRCLPDGAFEAAEFCGGLPDVPPVVLLHVRCRSSGHEMIDLIRELVRVDRDTHPVLKTLRTLQVEPRLESGQRLFATTFLAFEQAPPITAPAELNTTALEGWLWLTASVTPWAAYPPAPAPFASELSRRIDFSADWSVLVLRDGAGFVWAREDEGEPTFTRAHAGVLVRTVYTDALLMGEWQRMFLTEIADDMSQIDTAIDTQRELEAYEDRLARFRIRLWWQHVTKHNGHGNELLRAHARQHRLGELQDQVVDELESHTRRVSARASAQTNAFLALVTIFGLPVALVGAAIQVSGVSGWLGIALFAICTLALALAIVATRAGRRLARSLRDVL